MTQVILSPIIHKHNRSHQNDDRVANPTERVRDLVEHHKAQERRKNNLRIVKNRNVARGREKVGVSYSELAHAARHARPYQYQKLGRGGNVKVEQHEGQAKRARKAREKRDDKSALDL